MCHAPANLRRRLHTAALVAAQRVLPFYTHPCSPRKFTQQQLFACLVPKNFLKTDYRGVVAQLANHPTLREDVGPDASFYRGPRGFEAPVTPNPFRRPASSILAKIAGPAHTEWPRDDPCLASPSKPGGHAW